MSEQRRLAAILAADVAGYSRLMGEDEAGTARAVREHREAALPIVEAHGGRIVKTMGDGLLLEFPSVVAAIKCALAVQGLMVERNADVPAAKRIVYRMGVHLGDVLIEGEDIVGDGVNIAARLESIAEPGGICLSRAAHEQVEGKVEAAFVDWGERQLKNIARPVRVYAVSPANNSPAPAEAGAHRADAQSSTTMDPDFRRGGEKREGAEKQGPPRLSIVVLPFANIGGDPEQDYFVDGVTESLTTDLSRISGSFVIARNTAFTYKGKPVDVKQIGRELNVRYVLEGSVQRGGNRLRVNVQLIDSETGAHLWAERFDKPVADLFDMQDEIVARLANTLNAQLIAAEARRAETAPAPDAVDFCFRGLASFNRGESPAILRDSLALFEEALRLDPDNVVALIGVGQSLCTTVFGNMTDDPTGYLSKAENALRRALAIAPDQAVAHALLGGIHGRRGLIDDDIAECEHAIHLNPNLAFAHVGLAVARLYQNRPEQCLPHLEEAFRLSPRDPQLYLFHYIAGGAYFSLGRFDEALAAYRRSIDNNHTNPAPHFYLGAIHWHLGRHDEAKRWIDRGLALDPTFNIRRLRSTMPNELAAVRGTLFKAMRQAGVPER